MAGSRTTDCGLKTLSLVNHFVPPGKRSGSPYESSEEVELVFVKIRLPLNSSVITDYE